MGSSTGSVSNVIGAPPSALAEKSRQSQQEMLGMPGTFDGVRQTTGTIKEVHESKPLVKAYTDDGVPIANGRWIPLNHSPADIAERWGKLRTGLRLLVNYTGPEGRGANSTIIGEDGEREAEGIQIENDIAEGLFAIFPPGGMPV